jgi:hypothetical protein
LIDLPVGPVVLLFEFFPAAVMILSLVAGIWLYVTNRDVPDERAQREQRRREVAARAASEKAKGAKGQSADHGSKRPSMSA